VVILDEFQGLVLMRTPTHQQVCKELCVWWSVMS
jgi:hypothetical protein